MVLGIVYLLYSKVEDYLVRDMGMVDFRGGVEEMGVCHHVFLPIYAFATSIIFF